MPYIGRSTDGFGVRNRFLYLASASDTSVSGADANGATLTFTDGAYVDVYLNGVLLKAGTDYNTNTANTIAGLTATVANDEVTVLVYDIFTTADMVSATSGGTFSGNVNFSSGTGAITSTGIIKTDDTTDATSTTDGSLQTDGGLSVAKDVVVGDDILLKSDSAAIQFGADSEITLTHSADAGLSLRTSASTGPVLNIGTTSTSVSDGGFIGGIMFDAGSSNTATARIQALSNGTDEGGADFSFECRDSGASFNEKMRIGGEGDVTINVGDLLFGGSGKGINLGVTSNTDSNTLDDYEEGTWTASQSVGGNSSISASDQQYVKVGRMVHISLTISFSGSDVDRVSIAGLPFTATNSAAISTFFAGNAFSDFKVLVSGNTMLGSNTGGDANYTSVNGMTARFSGTYMATS